MNCRRARLVGVTVLMVALPLGCSKPATEGVLTGTVRLDGVALKSGQIRFVPLDGQSPTAGAVITDGQYRTTVPPGEKSVEITSPKEGPARKMYDAAPTTPSPADAGGELVPAKYNARTELRIDVKPGDEQHDFDLSSK
jgi:hypothetical protein